MNKARFFNCQSTLLSRTQGWAHNHSIRCHCGWRRLKWADEPFLSLTINFQIAELLPTRYPGYSPHTLSLHTHRCSSIKQSSLLPKDFFFLLLPWRNKLFLHWTCCLLTPSLLLCLPCLKPRSLCILSALLNLTDFHLWSSKQRRGSNTISLLWEGQSEASVFPPGCSLLHSFYSFHKPPAFVLPELYIF